MKTIQNWIQSKLEALTLTAENNSKAQEVLEHYHRAKEHAAKKESALQIMELDIAISLDPHNPLLWYVKGVVCAASKCYAIALESYKEVDRLEQEVPELSLSLGMVLYELGRTNEALIELDRATATNDSNAKAHYFKHLAYKRLDQMHKALPEVEAAIALKPLGKYFFHRAQIYDKLGDSTSAIRDYERAVAKDPSNTDFMHHLASELYKRGTYKEAIEVYHQITMIHKDDPLATYNIGQCYVAMEKYQDAIKYYETAIKSNPANSKLWYAIANAHGELNQHHDAIKCYKKVLEFDHSDKEAVFNLARAYAATDQHEQAISQFDRVIQLDPDFPDAYYGKAYPLYESGRVVEAIVCYDKELLRDPTRVDVLYNKGLIMVSIGETKQAIKCFDKALQLEPENQFIRKEIAKVMTELRDDMPNPGSPSDQPDQTEDKKKTIDISICAQDKEAFDPASCNEDSTTKLLGLEGSINIL